MVQTKVPGERAKQAAGEGIDRADRYVGPMVQHVGEDRPCSFLKFLAAHPGAVQQHLAYILQGGTAALSG